MIFFFKWQWVECVPLALIRCQPSLSLCWMSTLCGDWQAASAGPAVCPVPSVTEHQWAWDSGSPGGPGRFRDLRIHKKLSLALSFHRWNGVGPTELRKNPTVSHFSPRASLDQERPVKHSRLHTEWKSQALSLPSSDKLCFLLAWGKSLQACQAQVGNATLNCSGFLWSLLAIAKHRCYAQDLI